MLLGCSARGVAIACALLVAAPSPLSAQDADPSPSGARDAEARGLFEAGRAAFADGRFEDARDYFRRAHALSGRDALLYNIGSTEDRLRNDAAALEAFEAYLAAVPDAENASEVRGRIEVLRRTLAEAPDPTPPPNPPTPGPVTSGPSVVWTFVVGGVALAAGGAAIGTWIAANDQYAALERGCFAMAGSCNDAEISASGVEGLVTATNVLLISSLVLAAGTGVALALELTSPGDATSPHARLGVGLGSVFLDGSF